MLLRFARVVAAVVLMASAVAPSLRGDDRLADRLAVVLDQGRYRHSRWGILVVDAATWTEVYARNPDRFVIPASTTKLFTCAAALETLGADSRVTTTVVRRGDVENGTLRGDLILIAAGDLSLGGRTGSDGTIQVPDGEHTYADAYATDITMPAADPLTGLNSLAEQVRRAGIERVTGRVVVDDRRFVPTRSTGSGPEQVSAAMLNDNLVDFQVTPGDRVGAPAAVTPRPATSYLTWSSEVVTIATGGRVYVEVVPTGERRVVLRGEIPLGQPPVIRIAPVADPPAYLRHVLVERVRAAGVTVAEPPDGPPLPATELVAGYPTVARFESAPLRDHVKVTLKVSHNLYASTLPLLVAAHHRERTLAEGLRRHGQVLRSLGIDPRDASFGGGAGGSPADLTTPRTAVELLLRMRSRPTWAALRDGLPVLGVDGTLATAVDADSPVRGKVRAKTGTLAYADAMNQRLMVRSKALAGEMTTASGRELVFALYVNDVPLEPGETAGREGRVLGDLCRILYETAAR